MGNGDDGDAVKAKKPGMPITVLPVKHDGLKFSSEHYNQERIV